nr:MAG TPA: hypothetical protein [Caudoviricetes sp.]
MRREELFYETLLPLSSQGERDTLFKSLIDDEISRLFEESFSTDEYLSIYLKDNPRLHLALRSSSNVYERVEGRDTCYLFDIIIDLYKAHAASNASVHKVILNGIYVGKAEGIRCLFYVDNVKSTINLIRDNLSFFLCNNEKQYRTKG